MGRVYGGVHRPSGTDVAVKVLHPQGRTDPVIRRMFLDEASAAAKVDDPRIVQLLDLAHGEGEGSFPYLVMELARGKPIEELLQRFAGYHLIARALVDTLRGLASAHAQGVVHRDLKPANILVDVDTGRARILDFGVAILNDPLRSGGNDGVVGTPEYMPPEQLMGQGPYGPWTDLYAIGVVLAQLVRGASPFADMPSMMSLLVAKSQYAPQPFTAREGLTIPIALHELIERLLRPHARERPRFAVEVADQLEELSREVKDAVPRGLTGMAEPPTSTMPTIVGGVDGPPGARDALELPTYLPAPSNLRVGAALARLREPRMVGRDAERTALAELVDRVVEDRHARLIAYVGEGGIGKSRLARWGLTHIERNGLMESAAGGYDASGADIGGGLRHALRWLVGLPRQGWGEAWRWFAEGTDIEVDRLREYLGSDEGARTLATEEVTKIAHATLRAVGRTRPIYLWLDDIAWATDGAIQLVQRILEADDVPVLIVVTLRPGAAQSGVVGAALERVINHPRALVQPLGELRAKERAELLEACAPLQEGLAESLADRVGGSPRQLVELVRDWIRTHLLIPDEDELVPRAGASVDELLVERPLRALLVDRLDSVLSAFGERRAIAEAVLARAALLGARFERSALAAACARVPNASGALDEVLERALLLGVLRTERVGVYAFDFGLLHEAMVDHTEAAPWKRGALIDVANGLQHRYGKERTDIAMRVADLLWRARDRDRAWEILLSAIERAAWAGDDFVAIGYVGLARVWLRQDASRLAEVERAEGLAHYYALRFQKAREHVERATKIANERAQTTLALLCRMSQAEIAFYDDRFAEAEQLAFDCYATDGEDPDVLVTRSKAAHILGDISLLRDDWDACLRWREESLDLARRSASPWRVRVETVNLLETLAAMGRFEESDKLHRRVRAQAEAQQDEIARETIEQTWLRIEVLRRENASLIAPLDACIAKYTDRDAWRATSLWASRALLSALLDDDQLLERVIAKFESAFRRVAHEEAITLATIRRLSERLEKRGAFELARRIDAMLEERRAIHRDRLAR